MKLAILDDYQEVALELADWTGLGDGVEITVYNDHLADEDAVAARLAPFDVLCIMRERTRFPRSLLERLPNLKLIVTSAHRNAAIDLKATAERGITVCGTDGTADSTVEMIWTLIQAVSRDLVRADHTARAGRWQAGLRPGLDLKGSTIGLIGLGRLGARIAAIARFFGMRVLAWSENLTAERAAECGAELVPLEALMQQSDLVSVHLVLSKRTRGLIGARELGLMRPDALFVNTARGPIVDEAALVAALREQRIAGAALDVFDQEPLPPDHPLLALDNVIISPHMAYVTGNTYRMFYEGMVEAVQAWRDGEPIKVLSLP